MHWQHSVSWYTVHSVFSVTDNNIYLRTFRNSQLSIYFTYLREFVYLSRSLTNILRYRIFSRILHSIRMTTFTSISAIIFESDFLSFSFALCDHVSEDHLMTQNLKYIYSMHLNENAKILRCNWFVQIKKTQEIYHVRKHELTMKSKIKQKAKKLLKQQKAIRLIKKRTEEYTCRRCKNSTKFDSNIKLHEHIRTRHAKKSKSVVSQISESKSISFVSSSSSSFQSIIESSATLFVSSKLLSLSMLASEIVRERSESVSFFSSIATSRKSISWAEITSRSIVASKLSRLSIATLKSMCKSLKNANVVCSSTSSRIFSPKHQDIQKTYLIVNDLFCMFVEKSSSFDLQRHQMRSFSLRDSGKCNSENNCKSDFIQSRITSYFHAMITFAFKSVKVEAFESTHARENVSRQFSIFSRSISSISFSFRFSKISRSSFVCRHCQERFVIYRSIGWVMPNVFRVENNEIFMRQRYWSFASLRSTLRKYWSLFGKITTSRKLACCLFVCFVRSSSLLFVDRSGETKSCCMLCFIVSRIDRDLLLLFRLDLTRLIIVFFSTILET